jgi:hypothetical protein
MTDPLGPRPYSPNWYWQKHGYRVERHKCPKTGVKRRTIYNPDGLIVLRGAGPEGELLWINENLERVPDL